MSADATTLIADVGMVAGVGAVTGLIARRLGQPAILGYLLAGLIVGPSIPVPLFADPARIHALAELGVVLVMFAVGLEFQVGRLLRVLPRSGFTAAVQMGALGWAGATVGAAMGWTPVASAFLAASLCISSTMVVTGVFEVRPVDDDVQEHVLGVLVVQDVVAIVLMAAMTAVAQGHALAADALLPLLTRLLGVLTAMFALGAVVVPRVVGAGLRVGGQELTAVLAMGIAFSFAAVAEVAGFSVALGAFVAGMLVAESGLAHDVARIIAPIRAVFAAVFFVSIGMSVDPFVAAQTLPLALGLTGVVIVGQLVSVTAGGVLSGGSLRRAMVSGLALGQIGELSFILAGIGGDAVPKALLPTLVTVATLTSFSTPALLGAADAVVGRVDRALPDRVRHLLSVHQAWVERVQASQEARSRRALGVFIADGVGLVALAAAAIVLRGPALSWLVGGAGLSGAAAQLVVGVVVVAAALPLVAGMLGNARVLAAAAAAAASPSTPGARRALEAMVALALAVGVGAPAMAVLRPLLRGPWAEPLLVGLGVGAVVVVRRNLAALEHDYRSGVEEIAAELARRRPVAPHRPMLAGLDDAVTVAIAPGCAAAGKTLAELDLRARTGATVIAIQRDGRDLVLPHGDERLVAGDVVALAGSAEAARAGVAALTALASTDAPSTAP